MKSVDLIFFVYLDNLYKSDRCYSNIESIRSGKFRTNHVDQFLSRENQSTRRTSTKSVFYLNSYFVSKTIHLYRIYQIKSPIQPSNWNHLDIDEKLEQLVDINDTLFERIVIHS